MLTRSSLHLKLWDESFYATVFITNKISIPILEFKTPLEKLFQVKPNFSFLKVFDCLCFPFIQPYNDHKLQFRSIPFTFLGYRPRDKGYKCLAKNGKLYISRHVTFHKGNFPFQL